jgi:RNA 3'-phosphate cyclase
MGVSARADLERWGWYPRGGGRIEVEIEPAPEWKPVEWVERGPLKRIRGISATSNLPRHVAERQRTAARRRILDETGMDAEIEILEEVPGDGPGSFLFLIAESERIVSGFSSLGARGKRAETVALEAVDPLLDYLRSGACVDAHLADQLLIFMALASGRSSLTTQRVTSHLMTNQWVIRQFVNRPITISGKVGERGRVDLADA